MVNIEDIYRAINFLIDYIFLYNNTVTEQVNLFFTLTKRGDISETLTVLEPRLCT